MAGPAPAPAPNFTRAETDFAVLAAPALALQDDRYSVARDSPVPSALSSVAFRRPAAPARFSATRCQVQGVALHAMLFDTDDDAVAAALRAAPFLTTELRVEEINVLINAALNKGYQAGLVADPAHLGRFACDPDMLTDRTVTDPAALESNERYRERAHGNCPDALLFLEAISWADLYREGRRVDTARPACLLAFLTMLLGSRSRRATREEESSDLRVGASLLRAYACAWARLPEDADDVLVGRSACSAASPWKVRKIIKCIFR